MQILMMMMMMMMSFLYLALADQSLECSNDYYNTFTCVWNSSKLSVQPQSRCFIRVTVNKGQFNVTLEAPMTADPTQPHIHTGIVVFKSTSGVVRGPNPLYQEVRCENYTQPLPKIPKHKAKYSVVKVAPPWAVAVHGLSVSWNFSSSNYGSVFEVQFRSAAQSWTDVSVRETSESHLELSEDDLLVQHQFVIRVRVKREMVNAIWSDWSEEHSWTSEVGRTPPTPPAPGVPLILGLDWSVAGFILTALTVGVSVCVILIRCHRNKQLNSFYIPDPSKFFGDLNSHHGGNFTSWLGPILSRESFIKVNTEFVSPVEVLKLQDACESKSTHTHRHSGGLQDGWDGTNKSSNFSNSTYFLSQSSKGPSDTLEPCSPHSSYGPAGGISGPEPVLQRAAEEKDGASELEFCPKTLEKLRLDTQSPDSGFAGGAEDSMEEAELLSPLTLHLPAHLTLHLPAHLPTPQPVMHPLLGFKHTAGLSPIPGFIDLDLQSSCGMLEPSSGDYMPVKNVQS